MSSQANEYIDKKGGEMAVGTGAGNEHLMSSKRYSQ